MTLPTATFNGMHRPRSGAALGAERTKAVHNVRGIFGGEYLNERLIGQYDNRLPRSLMDLAMPHVEQGDRKLVLMVEDNELSALLFVDALHIFCPQLRVECFQCAEAAFEFAKLDQPDLIHLDCQLPYFSGFDFITWCRAVPALADVPTVMITAQTAFNFELRAPDHPDDPRYFGLPGHLLPLSNTRHSRVASNGLASCPRPDRVYYKPVGPIEYAGIVNEMMALAGNPLPTPQRIPLLEAARPAALSLPPRADRIRWRRGRYLEVDNALTSAVHADL